MTLGPSRTGITGNMLPGTVIYGSVTGPTGASLGGTSITACGELGELCASGRSAADGRYRVLVGEGVFNIRVTATIGSDHIAGWIGAFGLTFTVDRAVRFLAQPGMQHSASVQVTRAPRVSFIVGSQIGAAADAPSIPVRVAWPTGPTASYVLSERQDLAPSHPVAAVPGATFSGSSVESLVSTHAYRFDVRSGAGRWFGPTSDLLVFQDTSAQIEYSGSWARVAGASRSAGGAHASASGGASSTFTFRGRSVAWVSRTGPGTGMAQVFLDGRFAGTLDLSLSKAAVRTIVFAHSWSAVGTHTLVVTELGFGSHPPVEVDAFLVMD